MIFGSFSTDLAVASQLLHARIQGGFEHGSEVFAQSVVEAPDRQSGCKGEGDRRDDGQRDRHLQSVGSEPPGHRFGHLVRGKLHSVS